MNLVLLLLSLTPRGIETPFRVIGTVLPFEEPVQAVVRTPDEWKALLESCTLPPEIAMLGYPPSVPAGVDLESEMLIVVGLGRTGDAGPEGNAAVTIDSVRILGDSLLIAFTEIRPMAGVFSTLGGSIFPSTVAAVASTGQTPVFLRFVATHPVPVSE